MGDPPSQQFPFPGFRLPSPTASEDSEAEVQPNILQNTEGAAEGAVTADTTAHPEETPYLGGANGNTRSVNSDEMGAMESPLGEHMGEVLGLQIYQRHLNILNHYTRVLDNVLIAYQMKVLGNKYRADNSPTTPQPVTQCFIPP